MQGLADLGRAWLSFMDPMTLLYGLGGAFVGIVMGILPGLSATLATSTLQDRLLLTTWLPTMVPATPSAADARAPLLTSKPSRLAYARKLSSKPPTLANSRVGALKRHRGSSAGPSTENRVRVHFVPPRSPARILAAC